MLYNALVIVSTEVLLLSREHIIQTPESPITRTSEVDLSPPSKLDQKLVGGQPGMVVNLVQCLVAPLG